MDNKRLVIVLASNYATGLSVIRSLGAAGFPVDLIAIAARKGGSAIAARSKYIRNAVEVVSRTLKEGNTSGEKALLEEILKYTGKYEQKPLLFPTDDYTASVMDRYRDTLAPCFLMPGIVGGGEGSMTRAMDKALQASLAKEAGLRTPLEWTISLESDIRIPEDMVYPCFCKPMESVSGYKLEMAVCRDREALASHLQKLQHTFSHRSILVQEFLKIDREIDLSGLCLDQEVLIPAVIQKTHIARHELGVTLSGKVLPADILGPVLESVTRLLKRLRYFGMFDMELNIVGGEIYFNEINLRSGGPNYAYFKSGINLPALFAKAAFGEPLAPQEKTITEYGRSFVYEKVAWEDYIHGFLSRQELDQKLAEADIHLLLEPDDPVPGRLFLNTIRLKLLYHRLKGAVAQLKKGSRNAPASGKSRVLIVGRNYSSNLCLARSFGEAGYDVEVLRVFQSRRKPLASFRHLSPAKKSRYVKAYHECYMGTREQELVDTLVRLGNRERKMLLISSDDFAASIADTHLEQLSEYYLLPNICRTQGALDRMMQKDLQMTLAEKAGLPIVPSTLIKTEGGRFHIPEGVHYPCFVKPNTSKNSVKSAMKKCDSEEALRDAIVAASKDHDVEMLVQDHLTIQKEYALLGVSADDQVALPGLFVTEQGGHGKSKGVTMVGRLLPVSRFPELIEKIAAFVSTLGFEGLFDADLIETEDGRVYFVELNLRYGASGYAVTQSGCNLPGMFADYMFHGTPIDTKCAIQPGKTFVSERILADEYAGGHLSLSQMKQLMDTADIHFIKNDADRNPYRYFLRFLPAFMLKRFLAHRNKS